jgi:hypothetical protein
MKKLLTFTAILTLIATGALAADGICGKKGQTLPVQDNPAQAGSSTRADVEWSTTGAMDTPATLGGSADGWGTYFITAWTNDTGQDVSLLEFGWPCGGPGPVDWVVWITESLPGPPGSETFSGQWTPASSDPDELPPSIYSYVDVSGADIMVPAGATFYFGYQNPGIGGQIDANGTATWAWYLGAWDPDDAWGRTAVLQFKGTFGGVAVQSTTLSEIRTLFDQPVVP